MDSALEFLFVFGALGVWVVQRLVKRSRQQAARETAAEAGADLFEDEEGDEEFAPAIAEWEPEVARLPDTADRDQGRPDPPAMRSDDVEDAAPAVQPLATSPFAGRSLRDAVIMSEVLRRPKALR